MSLLRSYLVRVIATVAALCAFNVADAASYTLRLPVPGLRPSQAATPTDPYFANVTALLHLDGPNGSTTFTDQKGGTFSKIGSPVISTASSVFGGSSLYLNGTSALTSPYSSRVVFTGDFTVELWANISAHAVYGGIIGSASPTNNAGWQLIFDTSTNMLQFEAAGSPMFDTTGVLPANTWSHIAVVRHGTQAGNITVYINGISAGSGTSNATFDSAGSPLYVGVERLGSGFSTGYFDDVRLTPGIARYTGNFSPPASPAPDK